MLNGFTIVYQRAKSFNTNFYMLFYKACSNFLVAFRSFDAIFLQRHIGNKQYPF